MSDQATPSVSKGKMSKKLNPIIVKVSMMEIFRIVFDSFNASKMVCGNSARLMSNKRKMRNMSALAANDGLKMMGKSGFAVSIKTMDDGNKMCQSRSLFFFNSDSDSAVFSVKGGRRGKGEKRVSPCSPLLLCSPLTEKSFVIKLFFDKIGTKAFDKLVVKAATNGNSRAPKRQTANAERSAA